MTQTPGDPPHPQVPPPYPAPSGYPPPGGYPGPGGYHDPYAHTYQQPPPGAYGPAPGHVPPPGAYGVGGGYGPPPYDVVDGLRWSWNALRANAVPLIVAMLIWGVGLICLFGIPYVLAFVLAGEKTSVDSYGEPQTSLQFGVLSAVLVIVAVVALIATIVASTSAVTSGVLKIADGQPTTLASFLIPRRMGSVLGLQALIYVASLVGLILCVLPGIAVTFFSHFAVTALLDRNLSIVDAIKASVDVVKNNFGPVILMWLVAWLVTMAGQFACLIGLFVAIPLTLLFQVYTWRRLSGGPLAPAPV